jgi:hypothetical protein
MDDQTQNRILGLRSDELSGRTPFCPDDQHIAEYFDDALDQSERLALDRHLADCAFCLGRIGALHRLESGQGQRRVPEDLLATVKQLETRALRRSSFPNPGDGIHPGTVFRWSEVPDNIHYNVYVLTRDGDVLWTERLQTPEWAMGDSLQLAADRDYFFRVQAILPDGRAVSSKHVIFRMAARQ